jgi:uncharacterized membrane protein YphA (DoxX/SURF4 family)
MPTSLAYELETLSDGTKAAGHGGKNTGWLSQFTTLPASAEGIVVLTNSDNSGLIGFTTDIWADSLGVGPPRTAQMLAYDLEFVFTVMLVIGALCGVAALAGNLVLLRGKRGRRRTWAWRGVARPHLLGWSLRAAVLLAALIGAAAWWLYPVRTTLATLAPVRTNVATAALLALCLTAAAAALTRTRRESVPAEQAHAVAAAGSARTG